MPRTARKRSESGFYHVVVRGVGQQVIFNNDDDRLIFLHLLKNEAVRAGVKIIAWCLMDNHVHLLLEDPNDRLSDAMHRLLTAYAARFNGTTGHVGHVFENRFKSAPVEDERYLLEALRYIHDNPAKAGICQAKDYPWSSFHEYASGEAKFTDVDLVYELLSGPDASGIGGFLEFCRAQPQVYYRFATGARVPDAEVAAVAKSVLDTIGIKSASLVKQLAPKQRDDALRALRASGLTVKQIVRLTGVGSSTVTRSATSR